MFRSLSAVIIIFFSISILAQPLTTGKHSLLFDANTQEYRFTLQGAGSRRVWVVVPNQADIDIDLYINHGDDAVKFDSNQDVADLSNDCAPFNGPGKSEECYLNLNLSDNRAFNLLVVNNSKNKTKALKINLKNYLYQCRAYLYDSRDSFRVCPITMAQERHGRSETEKYRWKDTPNSTKHTGGDTYARDINFSNGINDLGKPVFAAISGKIIRNGENKGYGNNVIIYDQTHQVAMRYAHLQDDSMTDHTQVEIGDHIGNIGDTGTQLPHLHLVMYRNIVKDSEVYKKLVKGEMPAKAHAAKFTFPSRTEFALRP